MLFPANVASLPIYLLLKNINLLDNWIGVALPEAAFLAAVPALAFFVLAQRRIVGGLSGLAGSVKG